MHFFMPDDLQMSNVNCTKWICYWNIVWSKYRDSFFFKPTVHGLLKHPASTEISGHENEFHLVSRRFELIEMGENRINDGAKYFSDCFAVYRKLTIDKLNTFIFGSFNLRLNGFAAVHFRKQRDHIPGQWDMYSRSMLSKCHQFRIEIVAQCWTFIFLVRQKTLNKRPAKYFYKKLNTIVGNGIFAQRSNRNKSHVKRMLRLKHNIKNAWYTRQQKKCPVILDYRN